MGLLGFRTCLNHSRLARINATIVTAITIPQSIALKTKLALVFSDVNEPTLGVVVGVEVGFVVGVSVGFAGGREEKTGVGVGVDVGIGVRVTVGVGEGVGVVVGETVTTTGLD